MAARTTADRASKVLNPNAGLLTDFEVLQILRQRGLKEEGETREPPEALYPQPNEPFAVEKQVFSVLSAGPAGKLTAENVASFLGAIEPIQLTKAEKLQLLNLRPTTSVEIHLIIEDCEERLMAEEVEQLLAIIGELLGRAPAEEDLQEEGAQEEEAAGAEEEEGEEEPMVQDAAAAAADGP